MNVKQAIKLGFGLAVGEFCFKLLCATLNGAIEKKLAKPDTKAQPTGYTTLPTEEESE